LNKEGEMLPGNIILILSLFMVDEQSGLNIKVVWPKITKTNDYENEAAR